MHHQWGPLIVVYLFLGGLSGGALILSALATLAGRGRFVRVACYGALAAPLPVVVGTGLLVLDLGQPLYFWKLLVAFQPRSPMWIGTWLLTLFVVVSVPYATLFFPVRVRPWNPADVARWRRRLAAAGLPLGVGVGLYTGVLLSVLVARPLWNTPLLAQLFLVSAVSTSAALLIALLRGEVAAGERRALVRADIVLIAIELALIGSIFLAGRTATASASAALAVLSSGLVGATFWLCVVTCGLIVPLTIEVSEMRHAGLAVRAASRVDAGTIAALLVLAGGFTLRWVLVVAGQATALLR